MKKMLLTAFLLVFFLSLMANQAQAIELTPLVRCGGGAYPNPCTFCDFFSMINRIVQFIVIDIVPAVAILMLVIGGVMLFFAGGNSSYLQKAKDIIKATIIGMVIIFAAFMLVGVVLKAIGLADWTQDFYKNWWQNGFFQIPGC